LTLDERDNVIGELIDGMIRSSMLEASGISFRSRIVLRITAGEVLKFALRNDRVQLGAERLGYDAEALENLDEHTCLLDARVSGEDVIQISPRAALEEHDNLIGGHPSSSIGSSVS
jgi:hypothetical protein